MLEKSREPKFLLAKKALYGTLETIPGFSGGD
jgi:hypothetical protein